jgi:Lrp/AsnC family transcriptional regulator, regulator for asnA, asnC and gidA
LASTRTRLSGSDRRLVSLLADDGQRSAGDLAKELAVSTPTVRSRLKNLLKTKAVAIAGLIDPFRVDGLTLALVGITVSAHKQLNEKLEQLSGLDQVHWAAAVTGRYDIIVEVVLTGGMDDLYRFIDEDLSKVGGINSSETFVVMKGRGKWVRLPSAVRKSFVNDGSQEG